MESGTDATVSCVISGITQQLDAVVWRKSGTDVTTLSGSNYVVSAGTYGSNSQTTTLTVKAAANTADSTYTCLITSNEWLVTNRQTNVLLDVFGTYFPCTVVDFPAYCSLFNSSGVFIKDPVLNYLLISWYFQLLILKTEL